MNQDYWVRGSEFNFSLCRQQYEHQFLKGFSIIMQASRWGKMGSDECVHVHWVA
jgi:hypothetical protein